MPSDLDVLAESPPAIDKLAIVHRVAAGLGRQGESALVGRRSRRPDGTLKAPAIAALHGCGGPFPSRDGQLAVLLAKVGYAVLLPDSFGPTPSGWPHAPALRLAMWWIGLSNGGGTLLATSRAAPNMPPGLFQWFAAFYSGYSRLTRN